MRMIPSWCLPCLLAIVPSVVGASSLLTLDGSVSAKARTPSGFYVERGDAQHLTAGPSAGSVSDFRTAHAQYDSFAWGSPLADAMYEGQARFGELRGWAGGGAIAGLAYAQLGLEWQDDFRIVSSTLAFGTPVELEYTLVLTSGLYSSQSCDEFNVGFTPAIASAVGWNGAAGILVHRACGGSDPASVVTRIPTTIGALLPLNGELVVAVSVSSGVVSHPHNTASADAFDTARFYVDPVGSDFSYVTGSGVTYRTPVEPTTVPGPGTSLLVVVGLAGLFGHRWRRT